MSATATAEQIAVCARFNSEIVAADPDLKLGIALAPGWFVQPASGYEDVWSKK